MLKFKNCTFLGGSVKLVFEELQHRKFTEKFGFLTCIVFSQRGAKKISACEFCKDVRKFVCFGTSMSLPNYENVEKSKM